MFYTEKKFFNKNLIKKTEKNFFLYKINDFVTQIALQSYEKKFLDICIFFIESGAKGTARGGYDCAIIRRRVPFVRYKPSLTDSLKMFKKT